MLVSHYVKEKEERSLIWLSSCFVIILFPLYERLSKYIMDEIQMSFKTPRDESDFNDFIVSPVSCYQEREKGPIQGPIVS